MTPSWACRHAHVAQGPFFHPKDAMRHNRDISGAWTTFVLDKSEGFTQAGVERLNDSIRTYVWAILGAQAQTLSNIFKTGTGFDAQKQFLADTEDAIASPVDIPSSISRYQKTLQYASTPLDFVLGIELYLSPSDMALHPGNIQGYKNEIQIAGSDAAIGHNPGINEAEPIFSKGDKAFRGKIASPAGTAHRGPQNKLRDSAADNGSTSAEERQSATGHGRWDSGWPCGALVIISLASPEQLREAGSAQQWPRPTNFCEPSRSLSFPSYFSQCTQEPRDHWANDIGQGRSGLAS